MRIDRGRTAGLGRLQSRYNGTIISTAKRAAKHSRELKFFTGDGMCHDCGLVVRKYRRPWQNLDRRIGRYRASLRIGDTQLWAARCEGELKLYFT